MLLRVMNDTRIFSPVAVPRLYDTIGRYMYLFKRLTGVFGARFYRFEHIVTYSCSKVNRAMTGTIAAGRQTQSIIYPAWQLPAIDRQ